MHVIRNNHTAPLYLPHAGGLEGIMVAPGDTPIDDKLGALLDALSDEGPPDGKGKPTMQLTVKRWLDAGLLAVVEVADGPTAEELAEAEAAAKLAAEEAAAKAKADADAKAEADAKAAEAAAAPAAEVVPAQPVADLPPLAAPKSEG